MKLAHRVETALGTSVLAMLGALPRPAARALGVGLGATARQLGMRRKVAEDNLARAFPERSDGERARILADHYVELGRVVSEYPRLPEMARATDTSVFASVTGIEHLERARAGGRGAILLTGHFSNFELFGATLARWNPVDFVVRPLSNPGMEQAIGAIRSRAGVGRISADDGIRRVFEALSANRWVALLADQDARRAGVFVPFLGRPASTALGPARIALKTGAPLVMGFAARRGDGRFDFVIEPPLVLKDREAPDAAVRLTALHVARLEAWVRRHPALWFWLHRRWKTAPPPAEGE